MGASAGWVSVDLAGTGRGTPFLDLGAQYVLRTVTLGAGLRNLGGSLSGGGVGWSGDAAVNLLQVFLIPLRRKVAKATLRDATLRVAHAVVELDRDVRSAVVHAIAAERILELRRGSAELAEAAAELASRQVAAGAEGTMNELERAEIVADEAAARIELQRARKHPEMRGQEERERHAREAMQHRERAAHANTPATARRPMTRSSSASASSAASRERPRQPSHSPSTARRPIGACTAAASTNTV